MLPSKITHKTQFRNFYRKSKAVASSGVNLNVEVIPSHDEKETAKHAVFLHGLFGQGQSFKFLAKAKAIQATHTCHLVTLRNHGHSDRHPLMDYTSLASDVRGYLEQSGLEKEQVTLVGHSLGAKAAMTYACMWPEAVDRLVSLDASPVDRTMYPHLNETSERMIENALKVGQSLVGLPLEEAVRKIKADVQEKVLQTALLLNLNQDGTLKVNLPAIYENQEHIYGFPSTD